ncbi:RagB/SusD family nutrient uptake outer membrane protein [Mucilaginibacter sp. BJC16-A38]|uniref:RagB/SusD family nutrient uptake outer membrane protein n=1 Tax=Mucilaginibacter phenanthrenivorans TaxID=1234842 RepID=UPI0021576195|nr:RagB/SusD family nutrient uptake outer membrane protein [Mucilaginibacter phenanthrenivorans]MCR8561462.1 RagB/SusD family nutrient uptake outer membrane protein [Mucilaginibacter phenanthrenivorans]
MKKYLKYLAICAAGLLIAPACKKSFLSVTPKGTNLESQYYTNQAEAFNGLVAVYDVVGYQSGGLITKEDAMDAGSDDHVAGGGGSGDVTDLQVFNNYTLNETQGPGGPLWQGYYQGVFRANVLLQKLPAVPMDAGLKNRYADETKALRAYFYFDLVRLFKNIPLILAEVPSDQVDNVLQVAPSAVYGQIEGDLKSVISNKNIPDKVDISVDGGRLTMGAVHALLGKVYLYEKKYTESAAEFAIVNGSTPGQPNSQYGYQLLPNFADLWKVSNKFNAESILEVGHSSKSGGSWDCSACTEGNFLNIMVGPRGYNPLKAGAPDYISGYSFIPFTKNFFDFIHYDPRNKATVANLDSLKANGIADYSAGYDNTGYFIGKFAGHLADKTTGGGAPELNYPQNMYEIRLADTYLMEAEALISGGGSTSRAGALMTAVHTRAYNDGTTHTLAPTMANIKTERRAELAAEGHRWFDLVRWGDAPAVLGYKGFKAGRNEILPIPLNDLNATKLKQSKEYGGTL